MMLLLACTAPGVSLKESEVSESASDSQAALSDPAPATDCSRPGCLRRAWSYGSYRRSQIEPYLEAGIVLDNGYTIWGIEYVTANDRTATATVTLPYDLAGNSPATGFPIVANAHGTIGLDDPCSLTGTLGGTGLAGLFGGRGAIGVAPDYSGLGSPGFHRYLDAEEEAFSVLDGLRAASNLARWQAVPSNERMAVVGLSQGGHAVLSAAAWHSRYAPELDIRAFGASGPASVYEEQWAPGVQISGSHLSMFAMLVWSFQEAANVEYADIWADSLASTIDSRLTGLCTWSPNNTREELLTDDFPVEPDEVFSAAFLEEFSTGSWSQFPAIHERFEVNRVRSWLGEGEQTAPIAIWQGMADTTVLPYMTEAMVADLQAGGIDVDLHRVEGGTHTTTAFGFLAVHELAMEESVGWVQERLGGE